jgi:hypothetical protein
MLPKKSSVLTTSMGKNLSHALAQEYMKRAGVSTSTVPGASSNTTLDRIRGVLKASQRSSTKFGAQDSRTVKKLAVK